MRSYNPKEIFDRALASEFGIELVLDAPNSAHSVRRRLYAEREKLRSEGNLDYDGLSFIIKEQELWIIPRASLPQAKDIKLLDCRSLNAKEIPDKILSRGKSRSGFCIS